MADKREFIIYISSTFSDLTEERKAAVEVAARHGKVSLTCRAAEQGVVKECTDDVRRCDVYVGIVGMRYGFKPAKADNPQSKSITELEYDACEAMPGRAAVPRLMFLKDGGFNSANQDKKPERIHAFRDRVSNGVGKMALPFADLGAFKLGLDQALSESEKRFHAATLGSGGAMGGLRPRKDLLKPVVVIGVSGTDDALVATASALNDARFGFECIGLNDVQWLATLDKAVRTAQVACLLVTSVGLSRLSADASVDRVAAALRNAQCCGRPLTLMLAGVGAAQLPPGWAGATHFTAPAPEHWDTPRMTAMLHALYTHQLTSAWTLPASDDAATEDLRARLHAIHSDLSTLPKLLLPIVVVAPVREEMAALVGAERKAFAGFDELERPQRLSDFDRLAQRLQSPGGAWPEQSYFDERFLWRCFGAQEQPVLRLLLETIDSINEAKDGSRERRMLPGLRIVPRLYRLDDLVTDKHGSAAAVLDAAEGASLIVIDEFALLHPSLRAAARRLLDLRRSAVVSVCASDPAHSATRMLLHAFSFLQIGKLLTRFATDQDPRCEVAVNSIERLQRWLRLAIPDLLALGDASEAVPELVNAAAPLFAPTRGQP